MQIAPNDHFIFTSSIQRTFIRINMSEHEKSLNNFKILKSFRTSSLTTMEVKLNISNNNRKNPSAQN